jgi:single-strand DNA-binding protein
MTAVNRVILLGNLTRDPELSYLPSQTAVCNFGLAMNRKFKKQDGSQGEEVCFVDVAAFAKAAETLTKYLKKGQLVYIEGRLKFDSWQAEDGSKRNKLKVIVEQFQFIPTGKPQQQGDEPAPAGEPGYDPNAAGGDEIPF